MKKKSIAFFHYSWGVQIHTTNIINFLAERTDTEVYLYYYDSTTPYTNFEKDIHSNVKLIELKAIKWIDFIYRAFRKTTTIKITLFEIIWPSIVLQSFFLSLKTNFTHIIAVERYGLSFANLFRKNNTQKLIYYSLEIYIEPDHPFNNNHYSYKCVRKKEIELVKTADLLIIQSVIRLNAYNKFNNYTVPNYFLLPVCVNSNSDKAIDKSYFLHELVSVPTTQKIILYFGELAGGRAVVEILNQSHKLPKEFKLVFHGKQKNNLKAKLEFPQDVIWSQKVLPNDDLDKLVSSAYIGLAFYNKGDLNDKFTAYSSEKIARYCVSGIPFIAFENEDYLDLKSKYDCCVLIKDIDNLTDAIKEIDNNYNYFRKNALAASKVFDFNTYKPKLLDCILTL